MIPIGIETQSKIFGYIFEILKNGKLAEVYLKFVSGIQYAAPAGIEPTFSRSKHDVLPLNNGAIYGGAGWFRTNLYGFSNRRFHQISFSPNIFIYNSIKMLI